MPNSSEGNGVRFPIRWATSWSMEMLPLRKSLPVVRVIVVPVRNPPVLT